MTAISQDVLLARALLSRVAEPAGLDLWAEVASRGPVAVAADIRAGVAGGRAGTTDADRTVAGAAGERAAWTRATLARAAVADEIADLEAAERQGIRLVVPEDDEWPHFAFACLDAAATRLLAERRRTPNATPRSTTADPPGGTAPDPVPPLALWVRGAGDLRLAAIRSVAFVGTRAASSYGRAVTDDLAAGMVDRGFDIVSGGAYGIDACAHRAALGSGGSTVIVSAGGLDRPYPQGNAELFEAAAVGGLLVSESPPGAAPQRRRFLSRNRLIAALSTGTVVVEAAARSGALSTAGHCERLGRPVMAVPGPITSVTSAGCHRLLKGDPPRAVLVDSVADILRTIGSASDAATLFENRVSAVRTLPVGGSPASDTAALDDLDPTARAVYDAFPARHAIGVDELAVVAGVELLDVLRAVPLLELAGLVENDDDGLPRRIRGSSTSARRGVLSNAKLL